MLTGARSALPIVPHYAVYFSTDRLLGAYRQTVAPIRIARFLNKEALVVYYNDTQEIPSYDTLHFNGNSHGLVYDTFPMDEDMREPSKHYYEFHDIVNDPRTAAGLREVSRLVALERGSGWQNTFTPEEIGMAKIQSVAGIRHVIPNTKYL